MVGSATGLYELWLASHLPKMGDAGKPRGLTHGPHGHVLFHGGMHMTMGASFNCSMLRRCVAGCGSSQMQGCRSISVQSALTMAMQPWFWSKCILTLAHSPNVFSSMLLTLRCCWSTCTCSRFSFGGLQGAPLLPQPSS